MMEDATGFHTEFLLGKLILIELTKHEILEGWEGTQAGSPTQTCLCTHHQGFIQRGGRCLGYVVGTVRGDRFFMLTTKVVI